MSTLIRRRPRRTEQMVALRSALPVQLVTLRHDIPTWTSVAIELPEEADTTTPKVTEARPGHGETAARKGGQAR